MNIKLADKLKSKLFHRVLSLGLVLGLFTFSGNCSTQGTATECLDNDAFFQQKIWIPIFQKTCVGCHSNGGQYTGSLLLLKNTGELSALKENQKIIGDLAQTEYKGVSMLLGKPSGALPHDGGTLFGEDSEEYKDIEEFINRLENPVTCAASNSSSVPGLKLLNNYQTVRKATLTLAGKMPTDAEEVQVNLSGSDAMRSIIFNAMKEPQFYVWLKEAFNDHLLTDFYMEYDTKAINVIDTGKFVDRDWYRGPLLGPVGANPDCDTAYPAYVGNNNESGGNCYGFSVARRNELRSNTNTGIAREPLELISHVVQLNRPIKEILTADYIVVNPYSARSYGFGSDSRAFGDNDDPAEVSPNTFFEGKVSGINHAGILTSYMFLALYNSTDTNRNRARARRVYKYFLATDLLKIADRPIDPTTIVTHNPTLFSKDCTMCHNVMDPMSGAFKNWVNNGNAYVFNEAWYGDMLPPGFEGKSMPAEYSENSLQWLANEITNDPRFALAMVQIIHQALTGQEPLIIPKDFSDSEYDNKVIAYSDQIKEFDRLAQILINNNYNLKEVIYAVVTGPFFRAINAEEDEKRTRNYGSANMLNPDQLDRKIEAVTGVPWYYSYNTTTLQYNRVLLSGDYNAMYGGIDSVNVTKRIASPNGIMANIQFRMANDVSCRSIPYDFRLEKKSERKLMKFVEIDTLPEVNGIENKTNIQQIRKNIAHLHKRVLGESVSDTSATVDTTYRLFLDVWRDGYKHAHQDYGTEGYYQTWLPWQCRATVERPSGAALDDDRQITDDEDYTIRSWMAVMTYLLADYNFLFN